MPALNPFILKGSLSDCSEEVIKLTSLSPDRNLSDFKKIWVSGDTAPSIASHRGRGCPADSWAAATSPHSFTHLWGSSYSAPPGPKVWCCPMKVFSLQDTAICLSKQMGLVLAFISFQYKISLFCSTAGGREESEVNNALCVSCHLN